VEAKKSRPPDTSDLLDWNLLAGRRHIFLGNIQGQHAIIKLSFYLAFINIFSQVKAA